MIRPFHLLIGLLLLLSQAAALPAQPAGDRYDDSMQVLLRRPLPDSIKARLLLELANYWKANDKSRSRLYLDQARPLAERHDYLRGIYYWREGSFWYPSDPDRCQSYLLQADNLLQSYKNREALQMRSKIWWGYASCLQLKEDDLSYADVIINKAIPLARQARDSTLMGIHYKSLGVLFMNAGQYDKAEHYLHQSLALTRSVANNTKGLLHIYAWLGETYIYLGRLPKAKAVLDTMRLLLPGVPGAKMRMGYHKVSGLYFHHAHQYAQALSSFNNGLSAAGSDDYLSHNELTFLKIKTLIAAARYQEADTLMKTFMAGEGITNLTGTQMPVYEAMAELYAGLGQPLRAYEFQKKYSTLLDSLYRSRLLIDVNALEIKYKNTEIRQEMATLKARNEQIALRDRNSRLLSWLMAVISLLLFVVALLSLLYYRNSRKLMRQRELNYRHHLKEVAQQQQLQFGQAVLQGEEQERRRVARDLHDGLGGMLAGVKINLSGQVDAIPNGRRTEWTRIMGQLDHSVTELRRIAHNMMPVNLLKFGLHTALKDLCESLITPATRIDFQALGLGEKLDEETQIHIYRIVQELLSNAIKHAEARHIILQCSQDGSTFLITQEDDGKGFDPVATPPGMGLSNIRNRVGFLNGRMEIDSSINEGTIINIELYVGA
ncbi:tetratricopeptide repeat-containing sensor histidine kinase [Taibaiella koreensis]|uniref:tetratricopeptide repeat-containing sensor histidine kinase n=1 Tax=Taibaiella koreensis TaxID=1268548 RepID=UPI000E59E5A8|nr:sensor histidine kinase [Taibaiella koreensis]